MRYDDALGSTAVTLVAMPVAVFGIVQLPFVPQTWNVAISPVVIGRLRAPTVSGNARVSASRHGAMGTYTLAVPVPEAWTRETDVAAAAASSAATPTCTNRNRRANGRLVFTSAFTWVFIGCDRPVSSTLRQCSDRWLLSTGRRGTIASVFRVCTASRILVVVT